MVTSTTNVETEQACAQKKIDLTPKKIRKEVIDEFVENNVAEEGRKILYKVDQTNTFDNFFRINVWVKFQGEERVVPSFRIFDSFCVELAENGDIIDVSL